MIINKIEITCDGYIFCKSNFYSSQDIMSGVISLVFEKGVNKIIGEIDSGIWAASYLLSMYKHKPKDFVLLEEPVLIVNDNVIGLREFSNYTCYMDESYPLFSSKKTVRQLVAAGLKRNNINYTPDKIKALFCISDDRFDRRLSGVGNEIFKALAAIGFCNNKQVFVFRG